LNQRRTTSELRVLVTLGVAVVIVLVWGALTVAAAITGQDTLVSMASSLMPLMLLVAGGLLTDGWFRGIKRIKDRQDEEDSHG